MNAFQWIVLPVLIILLLERLVKLLSGRGSRRVALFWGVVWCGAAIAIAWPHLTTTIATRMGISRGTDLVVYFAVLFGFIGFYMIYVRMRRLDANLTLLVRKLAIEHPVSMESSVETGSEQPT